VTVVVRAATAADADAVTTVFLASRAAALPWLPRLHTESETRDWIGHVVLARSDTWVALEDDVVVLGFAALGAGSLEHLYVRPDRRWQGVGTLLLRQAQVASPAGFTFHVFARNLPARAFYQRHGCNELGTGDGSGNEEGEPDVTYQWRP
jgi:GNAT superfamily N-acetyltransferase